MNELREPIDVVDTGCVGDLARALPAWLERRGDGPQLKVVGV